MGVFLNQTLRRLQRGVRGVVGQIQEERLFLLSAHEFDGLVGQHIRQVSIELTDTPVLNQGVSEFSLGLLVSTRQ